MYIGFRSCIFIESLDADVITNYINFLTQFFIEKHWGLNTPKAIDS